MPKGIVISHANICHFLRSGNALYGMQPDDVVFQGASVAFDLSMEEIWVPYLVGATLFVASPAMMGDVESLPDIIARAGVTVLDTVPTTDKSTNEPIGRWDREYGALTTTVTTKGGAVRSGMSGAAMSSEPATGSRLSMAS